MNLVYLTLQGTEEGQAAHAHVHEIIRGLRRRGCGVRLSEVRYRARPSRAGRVAQMLGTQLSAARSLRWADVVYVRLHFLSAPLVWLAWLMRRAVVIEVNGTLGDTFVAYPELKRFRRPLTWLEASQLRRARLAICVTHGLADWVRDIAGSVQTAVVPNGADTTLFDPATARERHLALELPEKYVVFFGALSRWQGVGTMLRAAEEEAWPSDVKLVIVGDGSDRVLVEAATKANGERVVYLGHQPYQDIPAIVSSSLGSLIVKEGPFEQGGLLPLKLYESLACDVPVIVSNYPGIADVVRDHGFGYVVEPESPLELAQRVSDLRARGRDVSGRQWVVNGNSWDARAGETFRHLARLVQPA